MRLIRSLPPGAEFAIVVLGAFGYFIVSSTILLFFPPALPHISENHLETLLIVEPLLLAVLATFLRIRGWTPERLGVGDVKLVDGGVALGLFIVLYMAHAMIWLTLASILPHAVRAIADHPLVAGGLCAATAVAASMVNAVFEEVFVCGYVVASLKDRSTPRAVEISVALRLLYHTYQGAQGMISVAPLGFAFAWYYARSGRLRPLIIAHALFDLYGLSRFIGP